MSERTTWSIKKRSSRSSGVRGERRKVSGFILAYRLPGMPKVKYRTFDVRQRSTALALAGEFRQELERELVSGRDGSSVRRAASRSIFDHIDDFVAAIESRKRDSMYTYILQKLNTRLAKECGWESVRDIDADSLLTWRRRQKLKPKTIKGYLDALWAFCRWLVDVRRLAALPLRREDLSIRVPDESVYRAFTDDECLRLLSVADPVRRCCYLLAMLTGLRRAEINGLIWHDLHLDVEAPFLVARASTTKNGKTASLHVRDDLAAALLAIRPADAAADDPVFPDRCPSMEVFRADMVAAGIDEVDPVGRRAVFHSLRHTLATNLLRADVSKRDAMTMMRHSDPKLLFRVYADPSAFNSRLNLDKLPRFDSVNAGSNGSRMGKLAVPLTVTAQTSKRGKTCLEVSGDVPMSESVEYAKSPEKTVSKPVFVPVCHEVSKKGENWGTRIRT